VSCYGSVSYLAFLLSGIAIEVLLTFGSKDEETFRFLFIYCAAVSLVAFILSFFVRDTNYQYISDNPNEEAYVVRHSGWEHTREVLILKNFWRFFIVIWMIVIIRTVFYHQSIVLPLYMDRDLGDDTHYGAMIILNQIIIIITIPFFSYTIYYIGPYTMFIIVGLIAVVSPMFFMLGASYSTIIMFIVITSIGESLLAPRILEYTYEVAPRGKESVVLAISYLPLIFSIMFAGVSGGILLDNFCPEDGEQSCWKVWGIIAMITIPAVLVLFFFRKFLENHKFESQPFVPCSKEAQED
jgi:Na+/melibiose symporter-like transporter